MKDSVSNQQLYEAIMKLQRELGEKVDSAYERIDKRLTPLELWRSDIMGKIAVIGAVAILAANLLIEYIKERFLKNL